MLWSWAYPPRCAATCASAPSRCVLNMPGRAVPPAANGTSSQPAELPTQGEIMAEPKRLSNKLRVLAAPVAFNEEKKIGSVIDRFNRAQVDEILVVDDGSTDGTP